jgi:AcrR family transcriptional regulator
MNSAYRSIVQCPTVEYHHNQATARIQPTSWQRCWENNKGGNLLVTKKSDPRVQRTKQLLYQAFVDLARNKRVEELTVKDITEQATVNRATFYAHYADKDALLAEAIRSTFRQGVERRLQNEAVTSLAELEQLILAVCDFFGQFDGRCWQVPRRYGVLIEREITGCLADVLYAWGNNAKGAHMPDVATADLVASMAGWTIYGAVLHWSQQQPRQSAAAFARAVLPFIPGNLTAVSFPSSSGAERAGWVLSGMVDSTRS